MALAGISNTVFGTKEYMQELVTYRYPSIKINDVVEWMEYSGEILYNSRTLYYGYVIFSRADDYSISLFGTTTGFHIVEAGNFDVPIFFDSIESEGHYPFQFYGYRITIDTTPQPQAYTPPPPPPGVDLIAWWAGFAADTETNRARFYVKSPTGYYKVRSPFGVWSAVIASGDYRDYDAADVTGTSHIAPCDVAGVVIGQETPILVTSPKLRFTYTFLRMDDEEDARAWTGTITLPDSAEGYVSVFGQFVNTASHEGYPEATIEWDAVNSQVHIIVPDTVVDLGELWLWAVYSNPGEGATGDGFPVVIPTPPPVIVGDVSINNQFDDVNFGVTQNLYIVNNAFKANNFTIDVVNPSLPVTYGFAVRKVGANFNDDYIVDVDGATLVSVTPTVFGGVNYDVQLVLSEYTQDNVTFDIYRLYVAYHALVDFAGTGSGTMNIYQNGVLDNTITSDFNGNDYISVGGTVRVTVVPTFGSNVEIEIINTQTSAVIYSYNGTGSVDFSWVTEDADYEITCQILK